MRALCLQLVGCAVALGKVEGESKDLNPSKPHIMYVLADDFGWADADWHHPTDSTDPLATPAMTSLIRAGIELDQHYAFKFCSPTRSAIQSGRHPIHVNVQNYQPTVWDYAAPTRNVDSGFAGVSRNMTTLAAVMKRGGYATHFAGKWDVGMAHPDMTPSGRGYDTSLFYFHHDNDYWTSRVRASDRVQVCPEAGGLLVDLWRQNSSYDGPAIGLNNSFEKCAVSDLPYPVDPLTGHPMNNETCLFEDALFHQEIMNIIAQHDVTTPLFLFWAAHTIHGPLQVPAPFYNVYKGLDSDYRARYLAMVRWLDTAVADTVDSLKSRGMYDNTLIVFTSDNGGPVYFGGSSGANNFPLRGGKTSNFQGGIRVNAFVSGGLVPPSMRGKKLAGLGAVWDWYGTFADLAGVDPTDHTAAAAGLPPVDSQSLWPYLSGSSPMSPHRELPIGTTSCETPADPYACVNPWGWGNVKTIVTGIIQDNGSEGIWKLLLGDQTMDGWQGPMYPNVSTKKSDFEMSDAFTAHCGAQGCLFRLDLDPSEHHDYLKVSPRNSSVSALAARMLDSIRAHNATTFSPERGPGENDPKVVDTPCSVALNQYGGYFGPFLFGQT